MASAVCTNMAKCLMILTGAFYLLSAVGLFYIGIWVFSTYDHFDEIADATLTLAPASIIIAVSLFMCIVGILACIAAFKNNKLLLSVFFCLVLLVLIGEVMAGALGYVYRSKVESVLDDDLTDAVNKYNVTVYKEQIDYMQKQFDCCGIHNATDWLSSAYWKVNHTDTVPTSCCRDDLPANITCNPSIYSHDINTQGCIKKLKDEFRLNLIYIAVAVVFMACIQLLALISTCILVCRTKEQNYQILGESVGGGLRV